MLAQKFDFTDIWSLVRKANFYIRDNKIIKINDADFLKWYGNIITYRKYQDKTELLVLSDEHHRIGRIENVRLFEKHFLRTDYFIIKGGNRNLQLEIPEKGIAILTFAPTL